jgi:hypothetical protein
MKLNSISEDCIPVGCCITKCVNISQEVIYWEVTTTGYDLTKHNSLQDVINFLTDDASSKESLRAFNQGV